MWTDWQNTSPSDAKANIANLKTSIITGAPTTIVVSGVRVDYSTSGKPTNEPRRLIQELQDYLWQIEENGWDHTRNISPADRRPIQTVPEFL